MILFPEMVEKSWRVRANPYVRCGMPLEDAIVFCDEVECAMSCLDPEQQRILLEYAAGYKGREIAARIGISLRTLVRRVHDLRQRDDVMLPVLRRGRAT